MRVAPHAGAWIETHNLYYVSQINQSHPTRVRGLKLELSPFTIFSTKSHPTRVRGLKHPLYALGANTASVAPHAGAWIETTDTDVVSSIVTSHPTRVRGLKHDETDHAKKGAHVAPHAGAWIET